MRTLNCAVSWQVSRLQNKAGRKLELNWEGEDVGIPLGDLKHPESGCRCRRKTFAFVKLSQLC